MGPQLSSGATGSGCAGGKTQTGSQSVTWLSPNLGIEPWKTRWHIYVIALKGKFTQNDKFISRSIRGAELNGEGPRCI